MAKSIQMKNQNGEEIYPYALLKEFVLYNYDSGCNGTFTLSDSAENYKYIEVYYRTNDSLYGGCQKLASPNGKTLEICHTHVDDNSAVFWLKKSYLTFSGTTVKFTNGNQLTGYSGSSSLSQDYYIYVTRVVGYK